MKRVLSVLTAFLLTAPASAADLSTKDTPATVIPGIPGPSGFYVELGVGYGASQSELGGAVTLSSKGTEFEGRVGYDKKLFGNWGLGVYAEAGNGFDVNGKVFNITYGNLWNWGAGGKVFYDHGGGQVYGIVGFSHSDVDFATITTGHDGIKYGGGITLKVLGNAYVGLEFTETRWDGNVFGTSSIGNKQTDDRAMVRLGFSAN